MSKAEKESACPNNTVFKTP